MPAEVAQPEKGRCKAHLGGCLASVEAADACICMGPHRLAAAVDCADFLLPVAELVDELAEAVPAGCVAEGCCKRVEGQQKPAHRGVDCLW